MSRDRRVRIHYRRLPDNEQIFDQRVVLERDDVIVTVTDPMVADGPRLVGGRPILESGSRVVWFTFPGRWHDVGRFHLSDGTFTGCYGNILTPPSIHGSVWHTTDLFLDVWLPADGPATLLDEDELAEALARAHVDATLARRAREEADRLMGLAAAGRWPPPVVSDWTLARILADEAADGDPSRGPGMKRV